MGPVHSGTSRATLMIPKPSSETCSGLRGGLGRGQAALMERHMDGSGRA